MPRRHDVDAVVVVCGRSACAFVGHVRVCVHVCIVSFFVHHTVHTHTHHVCAHTLTAYTRTIIIPEQHAYTRPHPSDTRNRSQSKQNNNLHNHSTGEPIKMRKLNTIANLRAAFYSQPIRRPETTALKQGGMQVLVSAIPTTIALCNHDSLHYCHQHQSKGA